MNASLMSLEISVVGLGLVLMLADVFMPPERRRFLAYAAIAALGGLLLASFSGFGSCSLTGTAFHGMFVKDALAVFFKRFFLIAAILVLFIAAEFSDRLSAGISEYYSLIVFALAGMLFAASANDFTMLFVSIELITITFYVLTSFQRHRLVSLEAGVKYLILGGLSSAFMVFGIALIWGRTGKLNFNELAAVAAQHAGRNSSCWVSCWWWWGSALRSPPSRSKSGRPMFIRARRPRPRRFWRWGPKPPVLPAAARAVHGLAGGGGAMGERADRHFRHHHSLRQPVRHPAAQPQAAAGLLQHRPCGVSAPGRRGPGRQRPAPTAGRRSCIIWRVICSRCWRLHGHHPGGAGCGQRGCLGFGRTAPAFAVAGGRADDCHGVAGGHPAAGRILRQVPPLLKAVIAQGGANPGYYCLAFTALAGVVISIYYYFGVIRAVYFSQGSHRPVAHHAVGPGETVRVESAWPASSGWDCSRPVLNLAAEAAKVLVVRPGLYDHERLDHG